ncbi:Hypothetical_protein [Hexamita inflata]|uniref:Hypothetical_protein n=1 Tax=Hexamita inflata TaxID=28002 RepID=A0ABP1GHX7_9EUKA
MTQPNFYIPKVLSSLKSFHIPQVETNPSGKPVIKVSELKLKNYVDIDVDDENFSDDFGVINPEVQFRMQIANKKLEMFEMLESIEILYQAMDQLEQNMDRLSRNNEKLKDYLLDENDDDDVEV